MSEFVIHTIPGSPFARSVAATLEEKGQPWRLAALQPGEHKQPAHLALHPFGRVPVLSHGGFTLYETQAILRYLDRVLPTPPLTPAGPQAAARMDQAMNVNDWYLFPACAVIVFQRVIGPQLMGIVPDEAAIAAAMPKAQAVMAELARLLGDQPCFAGAALSLADLLLAPQLDFLAATPEWAALSAAAPNLVAWLARMNARASMLETGWAAMAARAA